MDIKVPVGQLEQYLKQFSLGKIEIKEGLIQTLALLTASDDLQRKILHSSETGVLNVCSARIQDIIHVTSIGDNELWNGDNIKTTECLVFGHHDNAGRVWTRSDKDATVDNSIPLSSGQGFGFPIDNLKNLYALIETTGDTLIVVYTR